jgi:transmembrane sensor
LTYDHNARRVLLREGEAFFTVRVDKSRPFTVSAGPLTVTAIGTAFNVRRDADSVFVTVSEGTVDVRTQNNTAAAPLRSSTDLDVRARSGHQVRYQNGRVWSSVDRIDPAIASSFREGKLQYVDEPLRGVIASINRYAQRDIEIDDPALGELHFTGTVFQSHIDDWLAGLDAVFPVNVTKRGGKILISRHAE